MEVGQAGLAAPASQHQDQSPGGETTLKSAFPTFGRLVLLALFSGTYPHTERA
jgi:hypothetical protein